MSGDLHLAAKRNKANKRLQKAVAMMEPMERRLLLTVTPTFIDGPTTTATGIAGRTFDVIVGTEDFQEIPKITASGALPAGLHFRDNGDGSADIDGVVNANAKGVYTIDFSAKDSSNETAAEVLTITVDHVPVFVSPAKTTFTIGTPGTFTVKTIDGFPSTAFLSEDLDLVNSNGNSLDPNTIGNVTTFDNGLTFTDNGDGTGTLSGTPTGSGGQDYLELDARSSGGDDLQTVAVTIQDKPASTGATSATFVVGQSDSTALFDLNDSISFSGFPTPSVSIKSGHLPAGLKFKDNGNGTADISGTPAARTGGDYTLSVTARNTAGSSAALTYVVHVDQVNVFTSANTATFSVGKAQTFTVKESGFPAASFTDEATSLTDVNGLTFTGLANGTATISGTPAVGAGGVYRFAIENNADDGFEQEFVLTVNEAPAIAATGGSTVVAGSAITPIDIEATHNGFGGMLKMSRNGGLPAGLTFTDLGDGEAEISGTPTATSGGIYKFNVAASNSIGSATQKYTLQVDQAPEFSGNNTSKSVNVTHGKAVNQTVGLSGFQLPFQILTNVSGGLTQNGLTLALNSGGTALTLTGTPASAGTTTFMFTVADADGLDSPTLTLTVDVA